MHECGEFEHDSWVIVKGYRVQYQVIGVRKVDGWIAVWDGQDAGTLTYVEPRLLTRIEIPASPKAGPHPFPADASDDVPSKSHMPEPSAPGDT